MASHHPDCFAAAQKGAQFVDEHTKVRVGPDGVFVTDRKVADLSQVVKRIVRVDVVEIRAEKIQQRSRRMGALIGAGVGAGVGFAVGRGSGGSQAESTGVGEIYAIFFGVIGAALGALIGVPRHNPQRVYAAP